MPKIERKALKEQADKTYNLSHATLKMSHDEDLSDTVWLTAMYDLATQLEAKVQYLKKKVGYHLGVPSHQPKSEPGG